MLVEHKLNSLLELINTSTNDELIWINGFLNGILSKQNPGVKVTSKNATQKITIVYGTETGNSKRLATDFAAKAKKLGHHAKIQGLDQYRLTDLSKEEFEEFAHAANANCPVSKALAGTEIELVIK